MKLCMAKLKLKKEDHKVLEKFVNSGTNKARAIRRANVLLLADDGHSHKTISDVTRLHRQSIWRIVKRYYNEGLEHILREKPRSGQPRKYNDKLEAEIVATACTHPPKGSKRWSVRLLTATLQKKKDFKTINRESVRLVLKKIKQGLG
jgi:putative transposase